MKDLTPPESLTETILRYKPQIEAALSFAGHSHSFDQIVSSVLTGKLHFYPLENSFVIMEHRQFGNWSSYHCFLAGGVFEEINALTDIAADNARKLGATKMTLLGRRGFERRLKPHGWNATHVLLERPL